MKKILITGADFKNKGGQSMLYITISELRCRFPDCQIYYPTSNTVENVKVIPVFYNLDSLLYMHGGMLKLKAIIKSIVKGILGKKGNLKQITELKRTYPILDYVIDISGFNLSSDWNDKLNFKYLEFIRQAKKYKIPVYLMPQSFGPFVYKKRQKIMDKRIKELLSYCKKIYVREKDGMEYLKKYELNNCELSADLVLQNKSFSISEVFYKPPIIGIPDVVQNSIGIIPNIRSFEHGNQNMLLFIYAKIIEKALKKGKVIYILRHAEEDYSICEMIKKLFNDDKKVVLLKESFNCLEYSALVEKFDFIVGSRYHALVHGFKKGIPALALGWAVKYNYLFEVLDMDGFAFDVREEIEISKVLARLDELCNNREILSKRICKKVSMIQKKNCFEALRLE